MLILKKKWAFPVLLALMLTLISGCAAKSAKTSSAEPPPSFTATAEDYGAVYVKWEAAEGAQEYSVYRRTYDDSRDSWGEWEKVNTTKNKSFTDTKVTVGIKYAYRAKSIDANGEKSGYSEVCEVTVKEATVPFVSVEAESKDYVTVSMRAIEGAKGYHIYRREYDADNKTWSDWTSLEETDIDKYLDKSVVSGRKYSYRATAVRADGTETGFSNGANVTVP